MKASETSDDLDRNVYTGRCVCVHIVSVSDKRGLVKKKSFLVIAPINTFFFSRETEHTIWTIIFDNKDPFIRNGHIWSLVFLLNQSVCVVVRAEVG